jgi:hypothetical protein
MAKHFGITVDIAGQSVRVFSNESAPSITYFVAGSRHEVHIAFPPTEEYI